MLLAISDCFKLSREDFPLSRSATTSYAIFRPSLWLRYTVCVLSGVLLSVLLVEEHFSNSGDP